ncbi:MAG: hypothetical protein PVJ67_00465 [Candidatus Pacearchaeota archaeon]|jgi:hypothetical protein
MCFKSEGINNRSRVIDSVKSDFSYKFENIIKRYIWGDSEKRVLAKLFADYMDNMNPKKNSLLTKYIWRLNKKGYDITPLNLLLDELENYKDFLLPRKFTHIKRTKKQFPNPAIYRKPKQGTLEKLSEKIDPKLPREIMDTKIPLN